MIGLKMLILGLFDALDFDRTLTFDFKTNWHFQFVRLRRTRTYPEFAGFYIKCNN